MNKEKNGYIFGFATILVLIVGTLLALLAVGLKPYQNQNIENEKKQNILKAIQVQVSRDEAAVSFKEYVKEELVLNYKAEKIGNNAFEVDIQKEYKSLADPEERKYPLYICEKEGKKYYVIPLIGTGLWGPIGGFIALESDGETVYGATFEHKSETPGLGAEITEADFYNQFMKKKIAESGQYTSIQVIKPGTVPLDIHKVDGITGGTLTSVGVEEMLFRILKVYFNYFKKNKVDVNPTDETHQHLESDSHTEKGITEQNNNQSEENHSNI